MVPISMFMRNFGNSVVNLASHQCGTKGIEALSSALAVSIFHLMPKNKIFLVSQKSHLLQYNSQLLMMNLLKDLSKFAILFQYNRQLTMLDLSDNGIEDAGIRQLIPRLVENDVLKELVKCL